MRKSRISQNELDPWNFSPQFSTQSEGAEIRFHETFQREPNEIPFFLREEKERTASAAGLARHKPSPISRCPSGGNASSAGRSEGKSLIHGRESRNGNTCATSVEKYVPRLGEPPRACYTAISFRTCVYFSRNHYAKGREYRVFG
ncbi:hypothetical protein WA026_003882 [Henosepilachna vigintioctopunctata]|uniref:Uncharacterized protein n=1 Tax=Henosepilachna vigintioctopunctata TaxID=420089 RepID=A0AAW1U8V6_9CUCU